MELNTETQKQNPDQTTIQNLQTAISEQEKILLDTQKQLAEIQKLITQKTQMDPDLKEKLRDARDILYENQDLIPWTGLGVSNSEQAVSISIDAENPEDYREIIEELVGTDIPVVIKKGGNPYMSQKVESPLKQFQSGISLDEIQCKEPLILIQKYDGSPACVTESTKTKLIERGWTKDVDEQQSIPVIGHIKDFYHDVRKVESGKTFQIPLEYYPDGIPENLRFGVIGAEIPDARHEFIFNGIEKLPEGIEAEIDNTAMPPNLIITTKQGLSGEQIIGLIIVNDTNGTKELHQYQIRIEN